MPVSLLPDIAQKTAYTQIKGNIHRYILSTSSPLCNIQELRYRQNKTRYQISRIGYKCTFDYFDNLIPSIVLPISQVPDIAQKATCTQNEPRLIAIGKIKQKQHKTL